MTAVSPAGMAPSPAGWIACTQCGAIQIRPPSPVVSCRMCRSELERRTGRSLDAALALSLTTLLLLIPANLAPFLSTAALGATRQSHLISGARELWREGWPALAVVIAIVVVVVPILRFGLLSAVLAAVRLRRRERWIGQAFRWTSRLQPWAMADVGLLALWIAYTRLSATVPTRLETGGICFIGAGLASLFTRATLNKAEVWRAIRAQDPKPDRASILACEPCGFLLPAEALGNRCPRCSEAVLARKPEAASRAAAFTLAALLLYLPANLFPMATIPIGLKPSSYTVLEGVQDLFQARLWGLGLLVLSASFAVPLLKLSGLGWFLIALLRRSRWSLVTKTYLYRVVEEIGRWSMVDPLVIAFFLPVMQFNAKLYGRAEPAATAFAAVVVLTMAATRAFDPRHLWDARRSA